MRKKNTNSDKKRDVNLLKICILKCKRKNGSRVDARMRAKSLPCSISFQAFLSPRFISFQQCFRHIVCQTLTKHAEKCVQMLLYFH